MKTTWIAIMTGALLPTLALTPAERGPKVLGDIDFFGSKGIDVAAVRAALPFHGGDPFPPAGAKSDQLKRRVSDIVKQITGRATTDVVFVCCDSRDRWGAFIGLQGTSYREMQFDSAPTGGARLPKEAMKLRERFEDALASAIMNGRSDEDDSAGYALPKDAKAKRAALAMRDYALGHELLLLDVLATSSDADHRAGAAELIGYGPQSEEQVDALLRASLDSDDNVRNNSIRALSVLARARSSLADRIPIDPFVRLLRSGAWSDHNKASLLLEALTERRTPSVLSALRGDALDPLIEMARWRSEGHAEEAILILGRIAGLTDDTIDRMIRAGEKEKIISQAIQS